MIERDDLMKHGSWKAVLFDAWCKASSPYTYRQSNNTAWGSDFQDPRFCVLS